jgi:protein-tyrosine phosphatase
MIDLHSHILPGIDDGAADLAVSLQMAQMFVDDGVTHVACTPHILPGLYANTGPQIRVAVQALQAELDAAGIPLVLVAGCDGHMVPDFVAGLKTGRLLTLNDTRYVLVEPPHHVAPQRFEEFFFHILLAGYVPILTHPERLSWVNGQYEAMKRLVASGVWMQITAGSLTGAFGRNAQSLAERMLHDGYVHILASDAHNAVRRPPALSVGRQLAAKIVGEVEAQHLVETRPWGVLNNTLPVNLPSLFNAAEILPSAVSGAMRKHVADIQGAGHDHELHTRPAHGRVGGWSERLRRVFN